MTKVKCEECEHEMSIHVDPHDVVNSVRGVMIFINPKIVICESCGSVIYT